MFKFFTISVYVYEFYICFCQHLTLCMEQLSTYKEFSIGINKYILLFLGYFFFFNM